MLTEAGVAPAVVEVDFHLAERDRSRRAEQQLTAISGEIDAVFATDDLMAGTVLGWAYRKGLRVPDDLRVIGFDGTDAARRGMPWLSTVQQPIRDLCRTAVELLLDRIEQPAPEAREAVPAVEFPVRLIQGPPADAGCRHGVPGPVAPGPGTSMRRVRPQAGTDSAASTALSIGAPTTTVPRAAASTAA